LSSADGTNDFVSRKNHGSERCLGNFERRFVNAFAMEKVRYDLKQTDQSPGAPPAHGPQRLGESPGGAGGENGLKRGRG